MPTSSQISGWTHLHMPCIFSRYFHGFLLSSPVSLLLLIFMIAAMPFLIVHIAIYLLPKFGAFVSFVTIKPLSHPTRSCPGRERVILRERGLSWVSGVVLEGSVCPGREWLSWERVVVLVERVLSW